MAHRRSEWLRVWAPLVVYLALIFVLSSVRLSRLPPLGEFGLGDKVLHALEYAVLCVLVFRALRTFRWPWLYRWSPLAALVLASLYGASDEWHQGLVGRDADMADWLADTVGAAVAAVGLMVYAELHSDVPTEDASR